MAVRIETARKPELAWEIVRTGASDLSYGALMVKYKADLIKIIQKHRRQL